MGTEEERQRFRLRLVVSLCPESLKRGKNCQQFEGKEEKRCGVDWKQRKESQAQKERGEDVLVDAGLRTVLQKDADAVMSSAVDD